MSQDNHKFPSEENNLVASDIPLLMTTCNDYVQSLNRLIDTINNPDVTKVLQERANEVTALMMKLAVILRRESKR